VVTVNKINIQQTLKDGFNYADWLARVGADRSPAELQQIDSVYHLMEGVVEHQQHLSGESELRRALNIAEILAALGVDTETLLAAMAHGLLLVSVITLDEIKIQFGDPVGNLVDGAHKMRIVDSYHIHDSNKSYDQQHMESVRKLLLALAQDVRVVLIKLAERLQIMRSMRNLAEPVQRELAKETKDIYAPMASRLGIWQLKWELEDLSFRYLEPEAYQKVAAMLDERRVDRENYIKTAAQSLEKELKNAGIEAEVTGRPKHIYSIWCKMKQKEVGFSEVFDVRATRVLVNNVADCYAVLGIVHSKWQPVRSEFDDYIATPKRNNYQSLHTAVVGPENKTLEIQIRSHEMHRHCEYGVASHWRYKDGGKQDQKYQDKIAWLRQLLEYKDTDSDDEMVDHFKSEIFDDRVYLLTPKGNVVDLPRGATALDFAYSIHTEVGHHFRGAKADGKIIPLSYELQNGQKVEILTSKSSSPSRDWLNPHLGFAKSARTLSKIRLWFKQQDYKENVSQGRDVLERELHRLGVTDMLRESLVEHFNVKSFDDFVAAIGRGDITTAQIAGSVNKHILPKQKVSPPIPLFGKRVPSDASGSVQIMGVGGLTTKTARCCKPLPFDEITGYITRGRGVTVHRQDCPNLLRLQTQEYERLIEVAWGDDTAETYPVDISIQAFDRQGLLRDITNVLTNTQLNVMSVNTHTNKKTYMAEMTFSLEVEDVDQLSRALTKIEQLPNVMEVSRKKA
jgi:GTP pyrophosphokinase